jgi:hypothetical protein
MIPGLIWDIIPERNEYNYLGYQTLEFVQAVYGGTRMNEHSKKRVHVTNYIFIIDGEEMIEIDEQTYCFCVCECYKMRPRIYDPGFRKIQDSES